jgi:hypothetical protein
MLARLRPLQLIALSLVMLLAVALVDYFTGYELSFFLFYFAPVALLAWWVGRRAALAMAGLCAATWYLVDRWSGHPYSAMWLGVWDGFVRLGCLVIVALALARIRADRDRLSELNEWLAATNAKLEASLAEIRKLQDGVQLVCAWTQRIKSEGRWMQFEEFMSRHFHLRFTHGMSEEAVRQFEAEISAKFAESKPPSQSDPDPGQVIAKPVQQGDGRNRSPA